MTEYPQDIIKAADDVCIALNIPSTVENCMPIMAALMARDERAAKIADDIGEAYGEDETGWFECSETITTAIRTHSEKVK